MSVVIGLTEHKEGEKIENHVLILTVKDKAMKSLQKRRERYR